MELDVTHMVEDSDDMPTLSGSVAELGADAGKITWRNSLAYAASHPLLADADAMAQAREYFSEFGAWNMVEETDERVQALTVQYIAGSIREMEHYDSDEEYLAAAEEGRCSGCLYKGDDGRWYFYLGS